jgi:hypothetical protein
VQEQALSVLISAAIQTCFQMPIVALDRRGDARVFQSEARLVLSGVHAKR